MSLDSVRVALVTRMNGWTDAPVVWDGHRVPTAVEMAQAARTPWCRASIAQGDRAHATQSGTIRSAGLLFIQVFTDDGIGPKDARDLADSLAAHLDGHITGALVLRAAHMRDNLPGEAVTGPSDGWYQINVTVPWREYV